MLTILRLLTIVIGAATAYFVLSGAMKDPLFRIPDLAVGAALVFSALLPRSIAPAAMTTASAFALGVFAVALMGYVVPGKAVNLQLVAAMAVNLATILLLHPRGHRH